MDLRFRAATEPVVADVASIRIDVSPPPEAAYEAADLLAATYWNQGEAKERIVAAQLGSTVWVVARGPDGGVVATARTLSDGVRHALVLDVVTAPDLRGRGVGLHVMTALLAHPRMRDVGCVRLRTRDAMAFYTKLGFVTMHGSEDGLVWMELRRPRPESRGRDHGPT